MSKVIGRRAPTEEEEKMLRKFLEKLSEDDIMEFARKIKAGEATTDMSDQTWADALATGTKH